ncbi:MAG TPA: hypothetical protein VGM33_00925 [Baekduia sp.]|jgi:hypothetical protein
MDGPIMPTPDHSHLLAKRSAEEQQGRPPPPADDLHRVRAIASVAAVIVSLV